MGPSILLRSISHQISGKGAAGIFRSPDCCGCSKVARMFSTRMRVSSDESVLSGPYSSTLPSRVSPWLMLPPAFEGSSGMVYKFYSLAEKRVLSINKRGGGEEDQLEMPEDDAELVGSSHGWLALFNERNCDLFLSNPLSRRHIKLPPIEILPGPEIEVVSKVIISCSPDEEECRVMVSFGPEDRLAFCRPGRSTEWTPIGAWYAPKFSYKFARSYEDFVYSSRERLFFCVTKMDSDDLEGWDLKDPASPRIIWSDEDLLEGNYIRWLDEEIKSSSELKFLSRRLRYLVFTEQSNQLFLVTRHVMELMTRDGSYVEYEDDDGSYPYKTIDFDVHEIDREGGKLRYVESGGGNSLDGLAMFIGINHSFAMSAAEFPELKPNSIYFTEDKELAPRKWIDKPFGGHDSGIFDYVNRTFSPCYYPCDLQSIKRIVPAPIWFTPSPH